MNARDLSGIGAGFSDLSTGSQAVFKAALQAMSHPGRLVELVHDAQVPAAGHPSSAGLLLALTDAASRLWLSPSLAAGGAAQWLRFHTGCTVVEEPGEAHLAWMAGPAEMPPLASFSQGTDEYPDRSATCILDVPALAEGGDWLLRGPGIRNQARLRVGGLPARMAASFPARFAAEWAANHASFPCGVDLFLAAPRLIAAMPRTARLELEN